jgi:Na+-driven multidrug efflux pump
MNASGALARPSLNKIAVPIVGEFVLGISVAMVGLYLASHTSDSAASTFGLTQQVVETLFVVFRVLAIGAGIRVTQSLGAGQTGQARDTAFAALGACTWAGLGVAAWLFLGSDWMLGVLNAPVELWPAASLYMALLAPSMLLEAYNLNMAAILRAHLYARESFGIMLAMHASHLLLAVLFMRGWGNWEGWGLNGYALAWCLSRCIGLALHLILWRLRMGLRPQLWHWWRVSPRALWPLLHIGLPGAAIEMLYRAGFMVSLSATARLGVAALATHSYTLQTLKFVLLISLSIGWACEIMVGRLVGSGRFGEADRMVRKGVRNGMLASGTLVLGAALAAPWLMRAFTRDPAIIAAAQTLLWLSVLLELGRVFNLVLVGALRATGDLHFPVYAGAVSIVLLLGVGSYVMGRTFGLPGIWLAYVADECVRGALMRWRWRQHGWLGHAKHIVRRMRQQVS